MSTHRVLHMNDLLSKLCLITKCSKYIRICSAAILDIGEHTANYFGCL